MHWLYWFYWFFYGLFHGASFMLWSHGFWLLYNSVSICALIPKNSWICCLEIEYTDLCIVYDRNPWLEFFWLFYGLCFQVMAWIFWLFRSFFLTWICVLTLCDRMLTWIYWLLAWIMLWRYGLNLLVCVINIRISHEAF